MIDGSRNTVFSWWKIPNGRVKLKTVVIWLPELLVTNYWNSRNGSWLALLHYRTPASVGHSQELFKIYIESKISKTAGKVLKDLFWKFLEMSEISFPVFLDSNTKIFSYKEIFFVIQVGLWMGRRGGGGGGKPAPLLSASYVQLQC